MKALKEMFGLKELGINMGSDYVCNSLFYTFNLHLRLSIECSNCDVWLCSRNEL